MKRVYAVAIALTCMLATAGTANADLSPWTGTRQQAINYVITRALSQRGVAYSYGGGNVSGPSAGRGSQSDVDRSSGAGGLTDAATVPGTGLGAIPALTLGAPVTTPATVPAPAPVVSVVGFDSSGLIVYAFAGVGIKMPRSSGEQYKVGRKVLPSQALPGDLIFYGQEGAQSVALFIGNGQMVEATVPAVTVSPVRTSGMTPYLTRIIEQ